ncbi:MAG TPA: flavin reductase family protein [Anaerolineae bacterium]|nr:flavin reductase family protein [Anaerolineae bacterium]
MHFNPTQLSAKDRYKLCIGAILPRPIAWVSTMSPNGTLNLAPYSYFNIASTNPIILAFFPQRQPNGQPKDTLNNIEAHPEFVINLTNEETVHPMNRTATPLPPDQSEFEWADLEPTPSQTIQVPRVAIAPIAYECTLHSITHFGTEPGSGAAVFGLVQSIYVRDDLYTDHGYIDLGRFGPIGRLAGAAYTRTTDTFDLNRIPPTP